MKVPEQNVFKPIKVLCSVYIFDFNSKVQWHNKFALKTIENFKVPYNFFA